MAVDKYKKAVPKYPKEELELDNLDLDLGALREEGGEHSLEASNEETSKSLIEESPLLRRITLGNNKIN